MRDATEEEMAQVRTDVESALQQLDAARFTGRVVGYPAELDGRAVTIIGYHRPTDGAMVPIVVVYNGVLHAALDVFVEGTARADHP